MAGSAHTLTSHSPPFPGAIGEITTAWTADDADGSIPTLAVTFPYDCELRSILTNPGTTAPTDNYDITAVDSNSQDRLQSVGANRDTANTEEANIVYASTSIHPIVRGGDTLTITPTGNIVNSATGVIVIRYRAFAKP